MSTEGNRRIVLLEPQPTGEVSSTGVPKMGEPKPHPVWATRMDKPSPGEGIVAPGIEGGVWSVQYVFREESVVRRPTEDWGVIDEEGRPLKIEGVFERSSGPRARRLVILCERTEGV